MAGDKFTFLANCSSALARRTFFSVTLHYILNEILEASKKDFEKQKAFKETNAAKTDKAKEKSRFVWHRYVNASAFVARQER